MQLTVDQALQKAVEAHKAGQAQEADRYYTAILKAQPKHPDANHNMGVLAVDVGKVEAALPFFKTALEANPSIAQFWLSYIEALIKLERLKNARDVFDQAKSIGAKGDGFDKLEQRLNEAGEEQIEVSQVTAEETPKHPPQAQIQELINLYNQGQLKQALQEAETLVQRFPQSAILLNIQGALLTGLGLLDESIVAFNKALAIKPDYADAYNNMGNVLQEQGKLEEAIEAYNKALAIKPDYADAYYNMGNIVQQQGKLEEAIEAYNKALAIKPGYADAYNNMGNVLQEQGKLEEAIAAYNKALTIKPDYAEAKENLVEILKIYVPKNYHHNLLLGLDKKIKSRHHKHKLPKADQELAVYTSNLLNEIESVDKNLSTKQSQIYRWNNVDLNCKRHMEIFKEEMIIPEFCFGCFKVQVDVNSVLDLIRLTELFYEIEFEHDLTRKCLVEVRPNIPGFYKGLIYCRGIEQAHSVKTHLDLYLRAIDKNLVATIKKGCSEFPLAFPEYSEIASSEEEMMQYPKEWKVFENEFDAKNLISQKTSTNSSLKEFCLSDYLIIQKWIDYAKGIGDPTSQLFYGIPVKYKEIWRAANARIVK